MSRILAWCRGRPWTWAVAAAAAAAVIAYAAGRFAGPARVEETDITKTFAAWDWRQDLAQTKTEGPTRRVTKTVKRPPPPTPVPAGCPECPAIEETTIEEDIGPIVTDTHAATQASGLDATEHITSKVTEARSAPSLLLGLGGGARRDATGTVTGQASLVGGVRVFGPGWLVLNGAMDLPATWPPQGSVTLNAAVAF